MSVRWHSQPGPTDAARACAHHIVALLEDALAGSDVVTLALSGGASPKLLFQELVASKFRWDKVHLFWVDERAVPPTHPQSNYLLALDSLIVPSHLPRRNIHRIPAELPPEMAAGQYVGDLRQFFGLDRDELPHFDVVQLGMGADAHTASLFPGEPLIDDREGVAAAVYSETATQWRITLLPGVLLAAKHSVFLVTGADKAGAVRAVFHEEYDPKRYPAQVVSHHGRRVAWFLDAAAARFMEES
ncbi:MAG: 6-phosphogluconolactonase [Bryobacteraceae bacterium]